MGLSITGNKNQNSFQKLMRFNMKMHI